MVWASFVRVVWYGMVLEGVFVCQAVTEAEPHSESSLILCLELTRWHCIWGVIAVSMSSSPVDQTTADAYGQVFIKQEAHLLNQS